MRHRRQHQQPAAAAGRASADRFRTGATALGRSGAASRAAGGASASPSPSTRVRGLQPAKGGVGWLHLSGCTLDELRELRAPAADALLPRRPRTSKWPRARGMRSRRTSCGLAWARGRWDPVRRLRWNRGMQVQFTASSCCAAYRGEQKQPNIRLSGRPRGMPRRGVVWVVLLP